MAAADIFNNSTMSSTTSDVSEPSSHSIEAIEALPVDEHEIFGLMELDSGVSTDGMIEGALEEPDSTLDNASQLCKKCK